MRKIDSLHSLPDTMRYLQRIGAEPRSMRTAVVKEYHGKYWIDRVTIHFDKDGTVKTLEAYMPYEEEAKAIKLEFKNVSWPEVQKIYKIVNPPDMIKEADPHKVFEFRDESGLLEMIHVRIDFEEEGEKRKAYIAWTYWDDGEWRRLEPDGKLPLYNLDKLHSSNTVFIHEGAKAARAVQEMIEGKTQRGIEMAAKCPWFQELTGAAHLGWIGGAENPQRTDWRPLGKNGVKRVYIVPDNDWQGRSAVQKISRNLKIVTFALDFSKHFPPSFDLADDFPEDMFEGKHYVGPSFRSCIMPATWATDLVKNADRKLVPQVREVFRNMWAWVEEPDLMVCTENTSIRYSQPKFNDMIAPFCDAKAVPTQLILRSWRGRNAKLCYMPGEPQRIIHHENMALNLYMPPLIPAKEGNITPFLEFLEYMFPKASEREQIMKWIATLIAHPKIRIGYGLLLVSEMQGIGKTTLGSCILMPLIGYDNTSFAGESNILSEFNDYAANVRLIIVDEIYSGGGWKAYQTLKRIITDREITVNQKYVVPYKIDNWTHMFCCSNSLRALKMEEDDRRWFYPEITEERWKLEKFAELRAWLRMGGLSNIRYWAENYGDYLNEYDLAPITVRKIELIEGSRSEAQREAEALAVMIKDNPRAIAITLRDVVGWLRNNVQGKVYDPDYEIKRAMEKAGMYVWPDRMKTMGRLNYVLINQALYDKISIIHYREEKVAKIRECMMSIDNLMPEIM